MRLASSGFRVTALGAALLVLVPFYSGCDTSPGPVFADTGVRSTTFTVHGNQWSLYSNETVATHHRQTNQITQDVVSGGVVLLYAGGELIFSGPGVEDTWTALPYTQGIENVGLDGVPYVDYTVTYTYSFGANNLYIDIVSSGEWTVDDHVPSRSEFRLVTIPPGAANMVAVDYSDYEAVKRAFGLQD
jgi:hypothetical protein